MDKFSNIQTILKRSIPGYIDSKKEDGNIIVTIPKANSSFFREMKEFPLLQQLPLLTREGYNLHTDFFIKEGTEDYDYINFKYTKSEIGIDWRTILDISESSPIDDEFHLEFIEKVFF